MKSCRRCVGRTDVGHIADRRHHPHQRTVGPVEHQRIPEDVPLGQILAGHDPSTLVKPVVHQHALLAETDQRPVDDQGIIRTRILDVDQAQFIDHPASAWQAGARGMDGSAGTLRGVPGNIQLYRRTQVWAGCSWP